MQLLVPMLSIVVLTIALATAASVYLTVEGASQRQARQLRRVVATVTEASFPLSDRVLQQMSGLSGGEFVLLEDNGQVVHSTIDVSDGDRERLRSVKAEGALDSFSSAGVTELSSGTYFAELVPLPQRRGVDSEQSLMVLYPKDRWWSTAREAAAPILISGLIAMFVGGLVIAMFAARFVRPIKIIGNRAMAIAAGNFDPVGVPSRDDEITDLATSINTMVEKLGHYESEVRRNERMRTLGQLGAGMAHQLRNAATGARMAIELHQRECSTTDNSEATQVAMRELRRMESYLQRFLDLGHARQVPHERVDLQNVVGGAVELVKPTCQHTGIDLVVRMPPETVRVNGDAESLRQLLINLLLNAAEAAGRHTSGGARIVVELSETETGHAALSVLDSGPGPDAATRESLFEPFVTEKPDGTGLGLYVARQTAEDHEGSIDWRRVGEMTCFTVELPLNET